VENSGRESSPMAKFRLTDEQQRLLRAQLCSTDDVDFYRRTQALLEVGRGRSPAEVSRSLGVSCSSIYNWLGAFARNPQPGAVMDHRGQGRPSLWTEPLKKLLQEALEQEPGAWGYQSKGWTVPLLQTHLERHGGQWLSTLTIRRKLHECGYVWKQFGYVLTGESLPNEKKPDSLTGQVVALPSNGHAVRSYRAPAVG
jgi:transposase